MAAKRKTAKKATAKKKSVKKKSETHVINKKKATKKLKELK